MLFPVHMLAFHDYDQDHEVIREVEVPDNEVAEADNFNQILELVFKYGQNDFQPVKDRCSVSVGDVVEHCGNYFLVAGTGFQEISIREMNKLIRTPRDKRALANLG